MSERDTRTIAYGVVWAAFMAAQLVCAASVRAEEPRVRCLPDGGSRFCGLYPDGADTTEN